MTPYDPQEMTPARVKEMADRLRRIETRLMRFFEFYGFDSERQKPKYTQRGVEVLSAQTSIADIIEAIPADINGAYVWHKEKLLGEFYKRPQ